MAPFNAYCEMTIDGGGWTLALKADATKGTFLYDAALWSNNATYNVNFPDLDHNEAKLQTWNAVAFTDVLVAMETPIGVGPLVLKSQKIAIARPSLFALFSPGSYVATAIGRNAWKALITNSSLQPNCNLEGFNSAPAGLGWPRSRIGVVSNQENDCNTPDSYIGIGNAQGGCSVAEAIVGNMASCGPDNGDKSLKSFGVVFVR